MHFIQAGLKQVNLRAPRREIFIWCAIGFLLFWPASWLDQYIWQWMIPLQTPNLDATIIFLTERFIFLILGFFFLMMCYRWWVNPNHQTKLVAAFFAVMTTGIMAYVLKSVFAIPRPFVSLALDPLVNAGSFAFPSGHTAVAFALLIPFWRMAKWLGLAWLVFALATGGARVYEFVHYPSDIVGGAVLGGVIGAIFSHPEMKKLIHILWQEREFRRQSFHFCVGFLVVFAHWSGFLSLSLIGGVLVLGLVTSFVSQYRWIPIVSEMLELVDRPRDKNFPGRGAFYYALGVFLTFLIFNGENLNIAYASILIMAVGDSLNHLFTNGMQSVKIPWNKRKNILGIVVGVVCGTLAAQFFVGWGPAFIASSIAIALETVPWRVGRFYLDDNILVPLVSGGLLWVMVG